MYPSSLYKAYDIKEKKHSGINIQIGNSAETTNNHFYLFDKLLQYKDSDIRIYAPLSYANHSYAKRVIERGKELFGDKFIPMTEFLPYDKYLEFLGNIDIVMFGHRRQQALGNTVVLLGLGKKVYMRDDISPWQFFVDISVKVYNIENIDLKLLDESVKKRNIKNIKEYFSEKRLVEQLKKLFDA